jgi:DNA polymerase III subunit beta
MTSTTVSTLRTSTEEQARCEIAGDRPRIPDASISPAVCFTVPYVTLVDALTTVRPSVAGQGSVDVLRSVLLETADGTLTVSAFDYETATRVTLPGVADGDARVLVTEAELTKVLAAVVKGSGPAARRAAGQQPVTMRITTTTTWQAQVEFTREPGLVDGKWGAAEARYTGLLVPTVTNEVTLCVGGYELPLGQPAPVSDYPNLPVADQPLVTVDRDELAAMLARVAVAAGRDNTLPALTGVRVEFKADRMRLVATDRYRLAVGTVPTITGEGAPSWALLPATALVSALKRMPAGPVRFSGNASEDGNGVHWVRVASPDGGVSVTMYDDQAVFPGYRNLIPSDDRILVSVDRADLVDTVGRATALAVAINGDRRGNEVELRVDGEGFRVTPVLAGTRGTTPVAPTFPAETAGIQLPDDGVVVRFNGNFLSDGLAQMTDPRVLVSLGANLDKPAVFCSPDGPDPMKDRGVAGGYLHLLVPIRRPR